MVRKLGMATAAIALALTLAGCGGNDAGEGAGDANAAAGTQAAAGPVPGSAVPAPAGQDWTETVRETPEGGMLMGNPDAKVKLIEYASLTCPHCAEFSQRDFPILKRDYIATGKVSLELRNYVRDSADVAASLIARCGGAQPFFRMMEGLYADQQTWFMKVVNMPEPDRKRLSGLPQDQVLGGVARVSGLDQFAKLRGIPDAKIQACLSSKAELDKLDALQKSGNDLGLRGTPSFAINGKLLDNVFTWEALEPPLREAVGS